MSFDLSVITVWDGKNNDDLRVTLESLDMQIEVNLCKIVVSPIFVELPSDVLVIKDSGEGVYKAMSLGYSHVSSDFLCFLNSGDYFIHDGVARRLCNHCVEMGLAFGITVQHYHNRFSELRMSFNHSGAILARRIVTRELDSFGGRIDSDCRWIQDIITKNQISEESCLVKFVAVSFKLGGISNRPSVDLAAVKFLNGNFFGSIFILLGSLVINLLDEGSYYWTRYQLKKVFRGQFL